MCGTEQTLYVVPARLLLVWFWILLITAKCNNWITFCISWEYCIKRIDIRSILLGQITKLLAISSTLLETLFACLRGLTLSTPPLFWMQTGTDNYVLQLFFKDSGSSQISINIYGLSLLGTNLSSCKINLNHISTCKTRNFYLTLQQCRSKINLKDRTPLMIYSDINPILFVYIKQIDIFSISVSCVWQYLVHCYFAARCTLGTPMK